MSGKELVGLPMETYLSLPAVSASVLGTLLDRCPTAAWFESYLNPHPVREDSALMDAGTIAHAILLEGSESCCVVVDPNDHPAEKAPFNIPDGWTNKSIKAARDAARAQGKIPILKPAMLEIREMVKSAQAFIASLKDTEPPRSGKLFQTDGGDSEITFTWDDGDTPCKIRPDRIAKDRKLWIDAKFSSASAEPDAWGRSQMIGAGKYVNASFYRRGIQHIFGVEAECVFLVTETNPPYLSSLVGMNPQAWDVGGQQVALALREWQQCVQANRWPGYPTRTCFPDLPAWVAAEVERAQMENPWGVAA